ncbi:aldo/keto reductase [Pseudomonas sp. R5-89-07]|uniref:aldo/keto reductase n=1 Tax=Pseudomonas sp. R5-89-07 TaxID=658644 RepID=UPI000F55F979|nr:aldo/keto reductase [Pseudomonas sp. R5-89-07]AZF07056.1 hypothetical protein C4J94_4315 [Pseudomonas sp. R5-89-07]
MFILGTEHIPRPNIPAHITCAWEMGCRSFDTAVLYKNHDDVLSALQRYPREDYELTVKIPAAFQTRAQLENLALSMISQSKLKHVDKLLIHSPKHVLHPDALEVLQQLQAKGYIKKYGLSNYTLGHLKALGAFGYTPMVVQNEINPFLQETELVNYCKENRIEVQAHSIFATGKVFTDDELASTAAPQNLTRALFSWLKKIAVSPIISTKQQTRLLDIWNNWQMASEENSLSGIELFEKNTRQCRSPEWDEFDLLPQEAYQQILRQLQHRDQYQP